MNIQAIDHLVLRTTRLDEMLAFYTDVLGCSLEKTQKSIGLYQLRAGSGLIDLLVVTDPPDTARSRLDHFCLQLAEFDENTLRKCLHEHAVEAGEVRDRYGAKGSGPSMYIHDPDGNLVELKAPPPGLQP